MSPLSHPSAARPAAIRSGARVLLLLTLLCGAASAAVAQHVTAAANRPSAARGRVADRPIRALYVTGGGFHDFVTQETILPPGIAARTDIQWTIDHTAGKATDVLIPRHRDTSWADQFDVVVYNMSFSHVVDPEWIERIAHAHRDRGVAAVILHGATHSYRRSTTDAWRELMGAASYRHDRQRVFPVERLAPDHPILKDVPKGWSPGVDELYDIDKAWPGMTPLAQAWSVETEEHHPVVWINTLGKARVFVTTLGHNNEIMALPAYLDLVTRGLLWTLGRLEADGTPAAGYGPRAAGN
jgi:type 1 glutamine amidotransferase